MQGCPTSVLDIEKGIWSAAWCGDEAWTFVPGSIVPNSNQPVVQGVGYVRDGVLAFQLSGKLLLPFTDATSLRFGSPLLTGTLVPLGEDLSPRDRARPPTATEKRLFALEKAVLGGRVLASDLLAAIGGVEKGTTGTFLCQQSGFELVRDTVCEALDIYASDALDFNPGTRCDSLSSAIGFTAFPALPGAIHAPELPENPCLPGPDGQPLDAGAPYRCSTPP